MDVYWPRQREKWQRMTARDLITLDELEQHVGVLNLNVGDREIETAVDAASGITAEALERWR